MGHNDNHLYALDAATGRGRWRFETGPISAPAVAGGVVYFGNQHGTVYALDAGTGRERWRFETGGSVSSSAPALMGGLVFVGSGDSNMYALDADTGQERWQFEAGGAISSSPSVAKGVVYFGSVARTFMLWTPLRARSAGGSKLAIINFTLEWPPP